MTMTVRSSVKRTAALRTPRRRQLRKFLRSRVGIVGLCIVVVYVLLALLAPVIAPWDPDAVDLLNVAMPPSAAHWMGTDQFGRDILSRVIYGARTSLLLGFCVVGIATMIGTTLGAIAGYYRGRAERVLVFVTDVMMTMPTIITAMAIITIMGAGLYSMIIAIAIAAVPRLIRVSRGAVLQVRELDFVLSAKAVGTRDATIIIRHVIPNALAPVIVQASLLMAEAVLVGAGLGFLGLGVAPPLAEWGQMLAEGRGYMRAAPYIAIFPGLAIIFLVLGLNLLGDGLRDTFDVRSR
jgi:peptide/nickel transport system permease protein